jgi:ADP-heptose:LPS heptosyltransferase
MMPDNAIKKPSKLLFLIWGGIGNMVMALPMIKAARGSLPETSFVILAQKRAMLYLLGDDPHTEKIHLDDPRYKGIAGKTKLIREIRDLKPDAAISTVPSPRLRSGMLAFFSGAGLRICHMKYGSVFFNIQIPSDKKHFTYQNLSLLAPLGILTDEIEYSMIFSSNSEKLAREFFAARNIKANDKIVGIHPGAGDIHKRWPAAKFIALGKELIKLGLRPVVFGGPDEAALVKEVSLGISKDTIHFTGNDDLQYTLALIKRCHLFISNDSGLAHCAAAMKIATIIIFGPTDPEVCAPISPNVVVVKDDIDCGPCYRPGNKYGCSSFPIRCLNISVESILQQIKEMIEDRV